MGTGGTPLLQHERKDMNAGTCACHLLAVAMISPSNLLQPSPENVLKRPLPRATLHDARKGIRPTAPENSRQLQSVSYAAPVRQLRTHGGQHNSVGSTGPLPEHSNQPRAPQLLPVRTSPRIDKRSYRMGQTRHAHYREILDLGADRQLARLKRRLPNHRSARDGTMVISRAMDSVRCHRW